MSFVFYSISCPYPIEYGCGVTCKKHINHMIDIVHNFNIYNNLIDFKKLHYKTCVTARDKIIKIIAKLSKHGIDADDVGDIPCLETLHYYLIKLLEVINKNINNTVIIIQKSRNSSCTYFRPPNINENISYEQAMMQYKKLSEYNSIYASEWLEYGLILQG